MSDDRRATTLLERECRALKKLCKEAIERGETVITYKTGQFDVRWLLKCIERAQDETGKMPYAAIYKGWGLHDYMRIP